MKTLPLIMLLSLFSLKAFANKERALTNYAEFVAGLKPGMTCETIKSGEEYDLELVGSNYTAKKKKVEGFEKTTILKIDGDNVYQLVESVDKVSPQKSSQKVLVSKGFLSFIPSLINAPKAIVGFKRASLLITEDGYDQKESATIEFHYALNVDMDVKDFCELKYNTSMDTLIFAYKGQRQPLAPVANLWVMKCGEPTALEDLRKLKLSSITFCKKSDNEEEDTCEENQNLGSLFGTSAVQVPKR